MANNSAASLTNHHNSITCSDTNTIHCRSPTAANKKKSEGESNYQKAVYTNFHLGMKCHYDMASLVNDMQGAAMRVEIHLPETFTSLFVDSFDIIHSTR